ncbi:DNA polymerase III subunit gamma/tau [Vibrio sp. S17_S38]|uniref:DNA polymerase III subunit gamma/tau n=1 Tax=Vibrio sp. S17_S38 TaxID=2720229 RepID=UPI0016805E69|nr:DNA polymerase III subunit gamma/tau [Vibrio sp. S17_S38]MBD1573789.1 DNA polymerase III subunit gamma/tau [Vibrio sp. S17_S38]
MSYLALARKWRPAKFEHVVGQDHVITALENALKQNRLHHAYLFSGTRGVGKTSIGRLFAKGLNCETGITDNPCGVCACCVEIDQGRHVDLLEIDAASRTKVEDTRELLDNVQYKPARGRFKVYLIDEVHMLSRHSFNALLKTLEEPPEYVKFLLATTDPQKLPVTILSRCLQFHLKPINSDQIHQQLDYVLGEEKITSEPRALSLISHAADGSMRDALSLSDQAIALGNGHIDSQTVANMLGTLDTEQAIYLLEAISSKQPQVAMDCLEQLAVNGIAWDGLLKELSVQLHRIAMYQALPATLNKEQPDAERVELLSQSLSPQDVQLYYQMALKGRADLPLAPTEKMAAEMLVLRMLAFRPAPTVSGNPITLPQSQSMTLPVMESKPMSVPAATRVPTATSTAQPSTRKFAPQAAASPQEHHYKAPQPALNQAVSDQSISAQISPENVRTGQPFAQTVPSERPVNTAPSSPPETENKPASLTGLRHQLRSKRDNSVSKDSGSTDVKKTNAAPANVTSSSVLERIASKHTAAAAQAVQGSPISSNGTPMSGAGEPVSDDNNEPYQWKSTQIVTNHADNTELTPTQIKQALEHEKTPEMVQKLLDESVKKDAWTAVIQQLTTAKMVEQLALNSVFAKQDNQITLYLRSEQAHLNTERAQEELADALSQHFQQACELKVIIDEKGVTPLELRESLYQDKLQQAFTSLQDDPNVQFLQKRFGAQLETSSVRPV